MTTKLMGFALGLTLLAGCRGYRSAEPPIHLNPNMDLQSKFKAQAFSHLPPEGTVPWGRGPLAESNGSREMLLAADPIRFQGKTADGQWVKTIPLPVTQALVKRGQERFNIYCAVCHDRAGTGKGPVIERGFVPPPDYIDPRILAFTDGELFNVITNGARNMPGYALQVPVDDRWAIVSYVRALQKMRHASYAELPQLLTEKLKNP